MDNPNKTSNYRYRPAEEGEYCAPLNMRFEDEWRGVLLIFAFLWYVLPRLHVPRLVTLICLFNEVWRPHLQFPFVMPNGDRWLDDLL